MEISKITGLPAHPLLVHLPVVLVPLMGLFAIVLVCVPRWRDRFLPVLVVGSALAWLGAMLAASSGEALEEDVEKTATLENHTELGDTAKWITLVFLLVVLGWWAWERWGRKRIAADHVAAKVARIGLPVLVVLTSLLATGWMVQTGHSGAKSVWEDEGKGDGGGDEDGLRPILVQVSDAPPPAA